MTSCWPKVNFVPINHRICHHCLQILYMKTPGILYMKTSSKFVKNKIHYSPKNSDIPWKMIEGLTIFLLKLVPFLRWHSLQLWEVSVSPKLGLKFNSSPLQIYRDPIGKACLPFQPPFFRGELLNFARVGWPNLIDPIFKNKISNTFHIW